MRNFLIAILSIDKNRRILLICISLATDRVFVCVSRIHDIKLTLHLLIALRKYTAKHPRHHSIPIHSETS